MTLLSTRKTFGLAYCDQLASIVREALHDDADNNHLSLISEVSCVHSDTHPEAGFLVSTTKTIAVTDRNGRSYRVTVEAL